jgi:hypothetical protein
MRTLSFQVTESVHERILEATRVDGAATVQEWLTLQLSNAADASIADAKPSRSEVMNAYGRRAGRLLIDAGYTTTEAVDAAPDEDLLEIPNFGDVMLDRVRGAQDGE